MSVRTIFKHTAILGSSTSVSIISGLVTAKFTALLLGPTGMGLLGLSQNLVALFAMLASMGVATGLVRFGAHAVSKGEPLRLIRIEAAAVWLSLALSAATTIALFFARIPVSRWLMGDPGYSSLTAFLGLGIVLIVMSGVYMNLLNLNNRVKALAVLAMINAGSGSLITVLCIWLDPTAHGIAMAIVCGSGAAFATTVVMARREHVVHSLVMASPRELTTSGRALLKFGIPYTASLVVGTGVQLLIPALILYLLDVERVGYYRVSVAAATVALAFLPNVMNQDYWPRLSAQIEKTDETAELIAHQQRVVMLTGLPIIVLMIATSHFFIPLVYSAAFLPAEGMLDWLLIGEIFRYTSWTFSLVILARCGYMVFLCTELFAGIVILGLTWFSVKSIGLLGAGMAHAAAYLLYFMVCWLIVRRHLRFRWKVLNLTLLSSGVLSALLVLFLKSIDRGFSPYLIALVVGALWLQCGMRGWRDWSGETHA